ncbi:hypothetical protein [Ornithinimicrobium sp. INDO-MA30-4]|uniref:hypothetical protein n=1 Tax=Ornithinimicrobium sp. INDO-MA30-4 TaxID=2908651 RepID=UPI001F48DE2D|nr:hypothetical protein [Ornithinimicrobium sp. INDO-MA30-4]UJH71799.1 hypothetical protein L0A91_16460 [Ornithinimicrobium sp. INDO-MA30-4]
MSDPTYGRSNLPRAGRLQAPSQLEVMTAADAVLFRNWLRQVGWTQQSEGPLGELLNFGDSTVALPRELWRDPIVAVGVAERIASAMNRDLRDVLRRLVVPLTDRIEFRLVGLALENGRIPLGAASEALKNGRRLLSATGTSAIAPARSVARRYRPAAQQLARDAELAHTEDGSFIFPLVITLERTTDPLITFDQDSVVPEPYERRVTRTLATAVASAVNLTGRSIDQLRDDDLDTASSVGVSRELCLSLDEMVRNSSVDEVAISFEWSPAFGPTDSLPTTVYVPREIRPQLRKLARRLARPEPIPSEVYSGPILEIGHSSEDDDQDGFFFVLDTYFRERKASCE